MRSPRTVQEREFRRLIAQLPPAFYPAFLAQMRQLVLPGPPASHARDPAWTSTAVTAHERHFENSPQVRRRTNSCQPHEIVRAIFVEFDQSETPVTPTTPSIPKRINFWGPYVTSSNSFES